MKRIISYVFAGLIMTGCNDFLDLKPIDFPTEETFYNDVKGLEGAVIWGIERSGFFNGREKWAKDFENQRV